MSREDVSSSSQTVYINNYARAQTDVTMYETILMTGSIGKVYNQQDITAITSSSQYQVVRMNRDTLYSYAVFDLKASSLSIQLPATNGYYMSLYVIDEDQYSIAVVYPDATDTTTVTFKYSRLCESGDRLRKNTFISNTRYIYMIIRTLVNPLNATDLDRAHGLQNAVVINQTSVGEFVIPQWDTVSLAEVSAAMSSIEGYLKPGTNVLGYKNEIDETAHLIGTATGWGGLPTNQATYELLYPPSNDSSLIFQIVVTDVPIKSSGFWSITVYNASGYLQYNEYDSYNYNSLTAQPEADGSFIIYFSATQQDYMTNWIYIYDGWNYMVRLYEPELSIIDGEWTFPSMTQVV